MCYPRFRMAQPVVPLPSPPFPGPFLDVEDMPENTLHHSAIALLELILLAWAKRLGIDALVAVNLACRWDKTDARLGVDPDLLLTIPHPPLLPGRKSLKQLRLWEPGHNPPCITLEVVSESTATKDYDEAPWAHAQAGVRELWVFDPELHGPARDNGPFLLQVWQRQENGTMKRTHAGSGPAWSEEMQAWLLITDHGTRLRLADDRFGKHRWPTEAEAEAHKVEAKTREVEAKTREVEAKTHEVEAKALEATEARAREAAESKAREAAEKALEEQVRARELAEAEAQALRRRLADLEARLKEGEPLE